jgi:cysteinyl-tRNA synthetase
MRLFNTLTRTINELRPLEKGVVKMYTCGLTVYGQPHIGNWVGYIYWDVLQRVLEHEGYEVIRTQNITDVGHLTSDGDEGEDKMQKGAKREGITAWDVADRYIKIADYEAHELLKLKRPTHLVRATDLIQEQIEFVQELEKKCLTYIIQNDGVYFDTSKLQSYGTLARLDIEGLQAGARVPIDGKKNITDFALWKFSHFGEKRDMEWPSPWGVGFPGWHLECSVIARNTLGDQIDIHCGGIDHIPVHHTNEIAQTESVTGVQFSQVWVHNNHIKVDGTKMSKSLGNIYTLSDIVNKGFNITAFKLMVLSKHYQTEGNFTWDNVASASHRLLSWRQSACMRWQPNENAPLYDYNEASRVVMQSLQNNLNTPGAFAQIEYTLGMAFCGLHPNDTGSYVDYIKTLDDLLGLDLAESTPNISASQAKTIEARSEAKLIKDWSKADALRAQLSSEGITLRDTDSGQIWSVSV